MPDSKAINIGARRSELRHGAGGGTRPALRRRTARGSDFRLAAVAVSGSRRKASSRKAARLRKLRLCFIRHRRSKAAIPRHVIHYRSRSSPDPMTKRREGTSPSLLLVPVVGLEPTRCRHQRILSPSRLPFHHTGVSLSSIYHPEGKFKRKRFTHQIRGRTGKKRRSAAASSAERKAEKTRPTRWPRASRSVSARTAIV